MAPVWRSELVARTARRHRMLCGWQRGPGDVIITDLLDLAKSDCDCETAGVALDDDWLKSRHRFENDFLSRYPKSN